MADFQEGLRQLNDQAEGSPSLGKDSVLVVRDQITQWAMEGRLFHAQQGNAATKLSFSLTSYTVLRPTFSLSIPPGVMVIPINFDVTLEDVGGTENHITWATGSSDPGIGTSTLLTITRMRTDGPHSSKCLARGIFTADSATLENLIEVKRWYRPFASADAKDGFNAEDYFWHWDEGPATVLVGPAGVQLHAWGGSALQGFGEYVWAEFPSNQHPG